MNLTGEQFQKLWGDGYLETFCGYSHSREYIYSNILQPFESKEKVCLEIGCGGGVWTNRYLVPNFKDVISIDVIEKSANITNKYFKVFGYNCAPIEDESIDFVFSFGVFCHLSNSAQKEYFNNIKRVLKKGGEAVVMFANWDKHPSLSLEKNGTQYLEKMHGIGWYYSNEETIKEIVGEYKDLMPELRDTVIYFQKK